MSFKELAGKRFNYLSLERVLSVGERTPRRYVQTSVKQERSYGKSFYLPRALVASLVARCSVRVVRSPTVHAPDVALGPFVPCIAPAPGKVALIGKLSTLVDLRMCACGSPRCGLPSAACSARPTPLSGLMQSQHQREHGTYRAWLAVQTLHVVTQSATSSGLPVHARFSVQRWQRTHIRRKRKPARNGSPACA